MYAPNLQHAARLRVVVPACATSTPAFVPVCLACTNGLRACMHTCMRAIIRTCICVRDDTCSDLIQMRVGVIMSYDIVQYMYYIVTRVFKYCVI